MERDDARLSDREIDRMVNDYRNHKKDDSGPCPPEEDLFGYIQGDLAAERIDAVRRHLALCALCQDIVCSFKQFGLDAEKSPRTWPEFVQQAGASDILDAQEPPPAWEQLKERLPDDLKSQQKIRANRLRESYLSVRVWRNLALAASTILLVALPMAVYKWVTLQRAIKHQEAYYQKRLAEQENKEPSIKERLQVETLNRRVEELATQTQTQAHKIDELSQRLGRYVKPSTNAVLSRQFLATREPTQAQEIELSKDKLFLNLHILPSEEKEYKTYGLIIKDELGNALWRDDQVKKDEEGNFDLLIEKSFLKPGEYVLEIYGLRGRQRDFVSQTRFQLRF